MKITKSQLRKIIKEEIMREAPEFRTGVPEEDVLQHGLDTEMYPTTKEEEASDMIAAALEAAYHLGGGQAMRSTRSLDPNVENDLLDMAMSLRDRLMALLDDEDDMGNDDDMDDAEYERRVARGQI
jgi:hypothetical protein